MSHSQFRCIKLHYTETKDLLVRELRVEVHLHGLRVGRRAVGALFRGTNAFASWPDRALASLAESSTAALARSLEARPVSLLRVSLPRFVDPNRLGNSLRT